MVLSKETKRVGISVMMELEIFLLEKYFELTKKIQEFDQNVNVLAGTWYYRVKTLQDKLGLKWKYHAWSCIFPWKYCEIIDKVSSKKMLSFIKKSKGGSRP